MLDLFAYFKSSQCMLYSTNILKNMCEPSTSMWEPANTYRSSKHLWIPIWVIKSIHYHKNSFKCTVKLNVKFMICWKEANDLKASWLKKNTAKRCMFWQKVQLNKHTILLLFILLWLDDSHKEETCSYSNSIKQLWLPGHGKKEMNLLGDAN